MTACNRDFSHQAPAGFTLLEVMVSLTIVAVLLVSLFRMQAVSIDIAVSSHFKQTAPLLAVRPLSMIDQDLEDTTELSGRFDGLYEGYEWTCRISDAPFEESGLISADVARKLKRLDIRVTGPGGTGVFELTTYRYAGG